MVTLQSNEKKVAYLADDIWKAVSLHGKESLISVFSHTKVDVKWSKVKQQSKLNEN